MKPVITSLVVLSKMYWLIIWLVSLAGLVIFPVFLIITGFSSGLWLLCLIGIIWMGMGLAAMHKLTFNPDSLDGPGVDPTIHL
ncbi:MAG: hypothetical protein ACOYUZ_03015 [Patescibacteria group bacterium]